jgi:hypothetical protein
LISLGTVLPAGTALIAPCTVQKSPRPRESTVMTLASGRGRRPVAVNRQARGSLIPVKPAAVKTVGSAVT